MGMRVNSTHSGSLLNLSVGLHENGPFFFRNDRMNSFQANYPKNCKIDNFEKLVLSYIEMTAKNVHVQNKEILGEFLTKNAAKRLSTNKI